MFRLSMGGYLKLKIKKEKRKKRVHFHHATYKHTLIQKKK